MIRCPSCARSPHIMIDKEHALLVGYDMTTFTLEKMPISFGSHVATFHDLAGLAARMSALKIQFEDHDNIACPCCSSVHDFATWVDAWEKPGEYFESDALCFCGGELWYDRVPYRPIYAHICEKCGWIKPKAEISGAVGE